MFKGEYALPKPVIDTLLSAVQLRGMGASAMISAAISGCFDGVDQLNQVEFTRIAKAVIAFLGQRDLARSLLQVPT